ncbi:MAG: hypothetical protein M0Z66_15205 [Thermaerobacter sp.]|nr:hypothetical protein [Thermaerobacter sp.]
MNGRRITALLLTAFLVAELMIRLQTGPVLPAASPDVWTEVAQGSYRAAQGSYLVPARAGTVLRRSAAGTATARPTWSSRFSGANISVYATGASALAVASTTEGQSVLPPYGKGFLLADRRQNLWLISQSGATLLLGGGSGPQSRDALKAQMRSLQSTGKLSKRWQLTWAADPIVVGQAIWYLTNRAMQFGEPGVEVWQLNAQGNAPVSTLGGIGITDLVGSGPEGVLAEDAHGDLLVIDPTTYAVRARLPGAGALAVGPGGEALLLQAAPATAPKFWLLSGTMRTPKLLRLPSGCAALGPAGFSAQGQWLAMLVRRDREILVYIVRVKGLGAGQAGDLLTLPSGAEIQPYVAPSLASGRVYLVVRVGGTTQTWERSIGDGQTALGFDRFG